MMERWEQELQALVAAVVESEGDLPPHVRRTAWLYAEELVTGSDRRTLATPLAEYVEAVVHRSHTVTGADAIRLRDAGYSENGIFEITLAAALGAGTARLRNASSAIREA